MAHSEGYCSVSEILISPKSVRMLNRSTGLVNPVNYTCQSDLAVTAIRIPARDAGRMQIIDGEADRIVAEVGNGAYTIQTVLTVRILSPPPDVLSPVDISVYLVRSFASIT